MGDPRRFDLFARFIRTHVPVSARIGDIAGGKGYLQGALRQYGFSHVHTYDKRKGRKHRPGRFEYTYRFFDQSVTDELDVLVGMHPDEATDAIITEAAARRIPFVLCPCCVKPHAVTYWGSGTFDAWVAHLHQVAESAGYRVTMDYLNMNGRNLVMFGKP